MEALGWSLPLYICQYIEVNGKQNLFSYQHSWVNGDRIEFFFPFKVTDIQLNKERGFRYLKCVSWIRQQCIKWQTETPGLRKAPKMKQYCNWQCQAMTEGNKKTHFCLSKLSVGYWCWFIQSIIQKVAYSFLRWPAASSAPARECQLQTGSDMLHMQKCDINISEIFNASQWHLGKTGHRWTNHGFYWPSSCLLWRGRHISRAPWLLSANKHGRLKSFQSKLLRTSGNAFSVMHRPLNVPLEKVGMATSDCYSTAVQFERFRA